MSELITTENTTSIQILAHGINNNYDLATMEKLLELQAAMQAREARRLYFEAMSDLQGELPIIVKSGLADFKTAKGRTRYTYVKQSDIAVALKPLLFKHGFSYRFESAIAANQMVALRCHVQHRAGHSETTMMQTPMPQNSKKSYLQEQAAIITSLKRHTIVMAFGVEVMDAEDVQDEHQNIYYADSRFQSSVDNWVARIRAGQTSLPQLIAFLHSKNVILSPTQLEHLQERCYESSQVHA